MAEVNPWYVPTTSPVNRCYLDLNHFNINDIRADYYTLEQHGNGCIDLYQIYKSDKSEVVIVQGTTRVTLGDYRLLFRIVMGEDRISVIYNVGFDGVIVEFYGKRFAPMSEWDATYLSKSLMDYYYKFMGKVIPYMLCYYRIRKN